VAIEQRRAARFFITVYAQPQQQPQEISTATLKGLPKVSPSPPHPSNNPSVLGAERDAEVAMHASNQPSILHGSASEVARFLHILLEGRVFSI
jgi:hypothetical protein